MDQLPLAMLLAINLVLLVPLSHLLVLTVGQMGCCRVGSELGLVSDAVRAGRRQVFQRSGERSPSSAQVPRSILGDVGGAAKDVQPSFTQMPGYIHDVMLQIMNKMHEGAMVRVRPTTLTRMIRRVGNMDGETTDGREQLVSKPSVAKGMIRRLIKRGRSWAPAGRSRCGTEQQLLKPFFARGRFEEPISSIFKELGYKSRDKREESQTI